MANQQANAIMESDEKDLVILCYLGRKVFKKTPDNEMRRQWWLANSEFTEHDLDLISNMAVLFRPAAFKSDKCRAHINLYMLNSDDQIIGADSPVTYAGLRYLVKKIWDSTAFLESRMLFGCLCNQMANAIMESDEKDPFTLFYLGRRVFQKTPENEEQRQWWLANSEFTEDDLDVISSITNLFRPMDASDSDLHINPYFSYSDDQIVGADLPVTYSGLRNLVKRIRGSAAFRESLGHLN